VRGAITKRMAWWVVLPVRGGVSNDLEILPDGREKGGEVIYVSWSEGKAAQTGCSFRIKGITNLSASSMSDAEVKGNEERK